MSEQIQAGNAAPSDSLGELLSKILGSQIQGGSPPSDSEQSTQATLKNDISVPSGDILSSLLSNSDLILKLPSIISAAKPIIELFSQQQRSGGEQAPHDSIEVSNSRSVSTNQPNISDRRSALLCAMKPYLNKERQQIVDYIVRLSRLGDILKTL